MTTMDDDLKLIRLVKDYKYLYDKNLKDYKSNDVRDSAWLVIANILDTDVDYVKRRWHILRNKFSEIRKKKMKTPNESLKYEWPLFQYLEFLDKHVNIRHSYGPKRKPSQSNESFVKCESEPAVDTKIAPQFVKFEAQDQRLNYEISAEPITNNSYQQSTTPTNYNNSEHVETSEASYGSPEPNDYSLGVQYHNKSGSTEADDANDPDLVFMRSMGLLLKDVKHVKKRRLLQSKICLLICDAVQESD